MGETIVQDQVYQLFQAVVWIHQEQEPRERRTATKRESTRTRDIELLQEQNGRRGSNAETFDQTQFAARRR